MPKAAREKMNPTTVEKSEASTRQIDWTNLVSDSESEWGSWEQNDPSKKTVAKDVPVANPSGDHHSASPAGKAIRAIPGHGKMRESMCGRHILN